MHIGLISELLDAILLPKSIAICKCETHTGKNDSVSQGNVKADAAAKAATQKSFLCKETLCTLNTCTPTADQCNPQQKKEHKEKQNVW